MLLLCFDGIKNHFIYKFLPKCTDFDWNRTFWWMLQGYLTFQRESRDELAKYGAISIASNGYTDKFFVCGTSPPLYWDFTRWGCEPHAKSTTCRVRVSPFLPAPHSKSPNRYGPGLSMAYLERQIKRVFYIHCNLAWSFTGFEIIKRKRPKAPELCLDLIVVYPYRGSLQQSSSPQSPFGCL
jgi:hypothetical protein